MYVCGYGCVGVLQCVVRHELYVCTCVSGCVCECVCVCVCMCVVVVVLGCCSVLYAIGCMCACV